VPVVIAKLVMDWYINYLPHVGLPPHRFRGTRIIDLPWFTPLVLGHNYHAIHHLWPTIPWHGYKSTFREKQAYLREHGVPIEHGFSGVGPRASTATARGAASR
jgi:beta-carotene hydroxylase